MATNRKQEAQEQKARAFVIEGLQEAKRRVGEGKDTEGTRLADLALTLLEEDRHTIARQKDRIADLIAENRRLHGEMGRGLWIGATRLGLDEHRLLRQSLTSRATELDKTRKAMEKAQLDTTEPDDLLDTCRSLLRLLDPMQNADAAGADDDEPVRGRPAEAVPAAAEDAIEELEKEVAAATPEPATDELAARRAETGPPAEEVVVQDELSDLLGDAEEPAPEEAPTEDEGGPWPEQAVEDLDALAKDEGEAETPDPVEPVAEHPNRVPGTDIIARKYTAAKIPELSGRNVWGIYDNKGAVVAGPMAKKRAESLTAAWNERGEMNPDDLDAPAVPEENPAAQQGRPGPDLTAEGPHRFYLGKVDGEPGNRVIIDRENGELLEDGPFAEMLALAMRKNGLAGEDPASTTPAPEPERKPDELFSPAQKRRRLVMASVSHAKGSDERWAERVVKGMVDADLKTAIAEEVGSQAKGEVPSIGKWSARGGADPMLAVQAEGGTPEPIRGVDFVAAVREAFGIPEPQDDRLPWEKGTEASAAAAEATICDECFGDLTNGRCTNTSCPAAA